MFSSGQEVQLKTDSTRQGTITGVTQKLGPIERFQVRFHDGTQFYPSQMLVLVEDSCHNDDPVEMLSKGLSKGIEHLRGALTHSRLSGKLANLVYSMDTTNTEFYPYQFKPVLNFLDSPSRGLLIADEVGLGKTIEAGLVWTELKARNQANRLVVVCPAMLKPKWIKELKDRFGEVAKDCSARDLVGLIKDYDAGIIQGFTAVVSMQGIRPPRGWDTDEGLVSGSAELAKLLDDNAYDRNLFDLVVVDEAHYMRNASSQTSKLGKLLRPITDGLVLLSATPIQTKSDDLFELMSLVDESSFDNVQTFQSILSANEPIVKLRQKILSGPISQSTLIETLQKATKHYILQNNQQIAALINNPPTDDELSNSEFRAKLAFQLDGINLLSRTFTRTRKRDVTEWRVIRVPTALSTKMTDVEREVYERVTEKVRQYAQENDLSEGLIQTIPQRQVSSSIPAAIRAWLKKGGNWDEEDSFNTEAHELEIETTEDSNKKAQNIGPLLKELISFANGLGLPLTKLYEQDTKFNLLSSNLRSYWSQYPKAKIVLFSYYRETLSYLEQRLQEQGIFTAKLVGGVSPDEKQSTIDWFKKDDGPQILLSSEVASEGVDLQFSSLLINYDLPWNPMKVEQRIGRIDRIGQKSDRILIWNLMYEETIDERVYSRLLRRLQESASAIGDMEAVLGDKIQSMTKDLLSHQLTPDEEIERISQTEQALANLDRQNQELEENAAYLVAHGDTILQKVKAAKEMGRFVRSSDLLHYVNDFLNTVYRGCDLQIDNADTLEGSIRLTTDAADAFTEFLKNNPRQKRSRIASSNSQAVKCRFQNSTIQEPGLEIIDQNHSLIRFISKEIQMGKAPRFPVITCEIDSTQVSTKPGDYAFAIRRWSFSGAKTSEILVMKAINTHTKMPLSDEESERLINTVSVEGRNLAGGCNQLEITECIEQLGEILYKLDTEGNDYYATAKLQNIDFISQQIVSFEEFISSKIKDIQETIYKLRVANKTRVIPAHEGRIRKNRELLRIKKEQLDSQKKFSFDPRDICLGVIRVN